jgi:hypothetical protein
MKRSFLICFVLLATLLLASGCAFRVQVRGYQSPEATVLMNPGMSVHIQPEASAYASSSPVEVAELTRMISDLLTELGYTIAPADESDLLMVYSYDHIGHNNRVRFEPQTGPVGGMKTVGRGGPYDHRLWLRVVNNKKILKDGDEQVVWVGGASLDSAPTASGRFVAMLLVAAFEDFPRLPEDMVTRKMYLSDARIKSLGY